MPACRCPTQRRWTHWPTTSKPRSVFREAEEASTPTSWEATGRVQGNGGGWYFILPSGALYAWSGSGLTGTLIAQLDPSFSANPGLLVNAQAGQGQATASASGSSLTITPSSGFSGVLFVTATASDGSNMASQTFQLTVAAPTLAVTPSVTSRTPASGATGVPLNTTITATFNEAVQSSTITFTLKGPGGAAVPAALSYNASTNTATLTPVSSLAASTTYTATVSGAKGVAGAPMAGSATWSFTTLATATFLKADTTTTGSWMGTYGAQGYDIVSGPVKLPAGDTVTPSNQSTYTWSTTSTDPRALQLPGSSNRVAAVWYSATSFTVDVNLGDGQTHDLELYFLDWDTSLRSEKVQLSDAASGTVLDTESIASFHGGEYLDWKVAGHLRITITHVAGTSAVLSGLFLNPVQISSAATFQAASVQDGGPLPGSSAISLTVPTPASGVTRAISQIQLADGSSDESLPGGEESQGGPNAGCGKAHKNTCAASVRSRLKYVKEPSEGYDLHAVGQHPIAPTAAAPVDLKPRCSSPAVLPERGRRALCVRRQRP